MSNQFYYGQRDYIQKLNELYDLYIAAAALHLADVATSGSYDDLVDKPSYATVASTGSYLDLLNKPALATVATSGSYLDLTNKPVLATVATSGAYADLTGKPTIPSANSQLTNDSNYITSAGAPVQSVAGKTGTVTLVKADVGLGNVDNTSDVNKPVSTAQQTALDGKVNTTDVINATHGGTGQSAYAVGDVLFANTTTTLSKLAGVATGNVLISGGVGTAPSYGKVGLTTHVSGTLPVANGGTGGGDAATARTNLSVYSKSEVDSAITSASGAVTSWNTRTGAVTLLTSDVTGVLATGLPVVNGGTGATTLTGYVKGNGTSAMTASTTVPGSDVSGNISGNAANVTGTVAVANGGTGATDAATARTNLLVYSKSETDALPFGAARAGLTNYIYPSTDRMWRDVYAGGWRPALLNQQWGGAQWGTEMVDGATGQVYKFDVATGYVDDNPAGQVASVAFDTTGTYTAQGFKVSEAIFVQAIWVKLYKVGNPVNSLQLKIVTDSGSGTTPANNTAITNGVATSQTGKIHTSKSDGEWYRFVFPTPPSLASGAYHFVLNSSGTVDSSNYWGLRVNGAKKYPHGYRNYSSDGATWNAQSAISLCFLVEPSASNQFFRSGGQFDGKLVFAEGSPLNQSKALINPLKNFFDPQEATLLHRVSSCVKGKPIADYLYGLDHDRILLMCDATTGYVSVRLWKQDGTLLTVTGNTDVSVGTMSGIAINFRAKGDGADYLTLTVNGTQQATLTAQTIMFDPLMRELGHAWLGGGFAAAPTWTQKLDMSSLPSANGWTWTGTGTEANCMSVSGGKLYQNKNGYGATDSGYYSKVALGFSNATGGSVAYKKRIPSNQNAVDFSAYVNIADGSKAFNIQDGEYFSKLASATPAQYDLKTVENASVCSFKGADAYLFVNGRLIVDNTAQNTTASSANQINFGDADGTSGYNSDVIYDYVAYYSGGPILPQIATGMALHEYAHWSGDKSSYLSSLYNSGSPISVKRFTGMYRNYVDVVEWSEERKGITLSPTTTATSPTLLPDMESFVLGERFDISFGGSTLVSAAVQSALSTVVDGIAAGSSYMSDTSTNSPKTQFHQCYVKPYFGLHKVEGRWSVPGGGATLTEYNSRKIQIRSSK